jgi:hypothetical protein
MGLLRCPASFQRLSELAMGGMINCIVYIDDFLVHSKNHKEHQKQSGNCFLAKKHRSKSKITKI